MCLYERRYTKEPKVGIARVQLLEITTKSASNHKLVVKRNDALNSIVLKAI